MVSPPPVDENLAYWDCTPQGEDLVIIGAAGFYLDMEKAVELALDDAARKASMYERLEGSFYRTESIDGTLLGNRFEEKSEIKINEDYVRFKDEFRYDPGQDVLVLPNEGVYVKVRYTPPIPLVVQYRSETGRAEPWWVKEAPGTISGYRVGVGYARARMRYRDTIIASYEDAAISIIKFFSSSVESKRELYQGAGFLDYSNTQQTTISASASLEGFYVLDTWIDPQTKAVWTLAIVRGAVF